MIIIPVERRIDWKHPPWVLLSIVVLNILVFAFYQSEDFEKFENAFQVYSDAQMYQLEWEAYLDYVGPEADEDMDVETASAYMISDPGFAEYIQENSDIYIPLNQRAIWEQNRLRINGLAESLSSNAFGYRHTEPSIVRSISYQFLHGDIFHLLGNMVFLLLTGFAVEAVIGGAWFLALYLVTGICSAFFYGAVQNMMGAPVNSLVGASGSVSGVMALYVVLYGFLKIEFFYWFFVVTGYFRAAAIYMLPFYVMKEVYMLLAMDNSNVAFTAHIGGFVCGAVAHLAACDA